MMLGANAPQEIRFKTDFKKMGLVRDGVAVEPLWPGRIPNAVTTQQGTAFMKDMTYYGA